MLKRILLVEDDPTLGETLRERLQKESYEVFWKQDARSTREFLQKEKSLDLVILDVGLPDGSGYEIAQEIRAKMPTPFLFVTAQSNAEDRLRGFELGAEEYIPKPFHLKELLLRVSHVLKNHAPQRELQVGKFLIQFASMSVKDEKGHLHHPPANDFKVLQLLIEKAPRVLSRDDILNEVWGADKFPNHRTVDNTIVRLRELFTDKEATLIRSVRGVGYQWFYEEK